MNIAITATGATLESPVSEDFDHCPFLIIVTVESMTKPLTVNAIPHTVSPGSSVELAQTVLRHRCEGVITGIIGEEAFNVLSDDGVTRFLGTGFTAYAALEAMDANVLDLVRNPNGVEGCLSEHEEQAQHGLGDLRESGAHVH